MIVSERANIIAIPLFQIPRMLVRPDYVASGIVNANHSIA
jgi:hypothetical protein